MPDQSNIRLSELNKRLNWFIRLRWLAIVGVIITINFTQLFFQLGLPTGFLYLLSALLATTNIVYSNINNYIKHNKTLKNDFLFITNFAKIQIIIDLILLSLLIYGGGGVDNPFLYFFVFHFLISSILLTPRATYTIVTFILTFFSGLILLSTFNTIPYFTLPGLGMHYNIPPDIIYPLSKLLGLIITSYFLIWISNSITQRLNKKEAQLEKVNEELIIINEEKTRFMTQVTHELRAPLAAVKTYLAVILDGYIGDVGNKIKETLNNSNRRIKDMLQMVNELLDLSQIKSAQKEPLQKEDQNLKELINKQVEHLSPNINEKSIAVKTEIADNIKVYANLDQLTILINNLLSNAVRYTEKNGEIILSAEQQNQGILIKVKDNGIGILAEDQKHIFEEFFRTQVAVTKETAGSGLGLTIVSNIVKSHHGKIWVESELTKGSTFFVFLPKQ